MTDANTGIEFWLSEPAKNLKEWLELMNEHYDALSRRLKK